MKYLTIVVFLYIVLLSIFTFFCINSESYANIVFTKLLNYSYNKKTIKIAVIDTGFDFESTWPTYKFNKWINKQIWFFRSKPSPIKKPKLCNYGHKDFTKTDIQDNHGHGTHVAGIIGQHVGNANYCLIIIKYYTPDTDGIVNLKRSIKSLQYAFNIKVDIINYSGGGPKSSPEEYAIVKKLLDRGTILIFAAGNDKKNIDIFENKYYPASYDPRIIVVGNTDKKGKKNISSNYGKTIDFWEIGNGVLSLLLNNTVGYMSGTSQATSVRTGKIIKKMYQKK